MSLDHQMSERVYRDLKEDVLSGVLGGGRLNLASLDERYSSSATPVREALLRLVGEGLVDLLHRGGFGVHEIDEDGLRDLYELNFRVLALATSWRPRPVSPWPTEIETPSALNPPIDALFSTVAQRAGSPGYQALVGMLNDRLQRARLAEAMIIPDTLLEYDSLLSIVLSPRRASLRRALTHYHRRRLRIVSEIIRHMKSL